MFLIAWMPVMAEWGCAEVFPHFEERFPSTILVIPYIEFISIPLTLMVFLIVLYKTVKLVLTAVDRRRKGGNTGQR
jgi:hypothetical protein